MTFIQPKKNNQLINRIMFAIVIPIIFEVFTLIILYNQNVSLNHDISKTDEKIKEIEAQSAQIKEKAFTLLNSASLDKVAADNQLVIEKNPEYFSTNKQWAFASQQ